jgi:hypothetical protein
MSDNDPFYDQFSIVGLPEECVDKAVQKYSLKECLETYYVIVKSGTHQHYIGEHWKAVGRNPAHAYGLGDDYPYLYESRNEAAQDARCINDSARVELVSVMPVEDHPCRLKQDLQPLLNRLRKLLYRHPELRLGQIIHCIPNSFNLENEELITRLSEKFS